MKSTLELIEQWRSLTQWYHKAFAPPKAIRDQKHKRLVEVLDAIAADMARRGMDSAPINGYVERICTHPGIAGIAYADEEAAIEDLCDRASSDESGGQPEPFVFVPLQRRIWLALDRCAMTKQALADKVCAGEGTRLYRKHGINEMKEASIVKHKHGVGYYRPDAPPPELVCKVKPN